MNAKPIQTPDKRNYGIDALRLVSIFLIVVLHLLGFGGVLENSSGAGRGIASLLWVICLCGVNCFGLISGYVSYSEEEKPYRYARYAPLWLQVVFYSFGVSLAVFLVRPDLVDVSTLIRHALPVSSSHYWYFTAYSILFFMIPWLNRLVRSCSRREMNLLVAALFLLFSCFATFASLFGTGLGLDKGYSFLWLAALYLMGAWMKKCAVPQRIKALPALICAAVCVALSYLTRALLGTSLLMTYISPTMVLLAAALFILFARMKPGARARRWIACFAPAAFGVYLIHLQLTIWKYCINGCFTWIASSPAWLLLLQLLLCAGGIFVACLLIEKARMLIFARLGINRRVESLCSRAGARIAAILARFIRE